MLSENKEITREMVDAALWKFIRTASKELKNARDTYAAKEVLCYGADLTFIYDDLKKNWSNDYARYFLRQVGVVLRHYNVFPILNKNDLRRIKK